MQPLKSRTWKTGHLKLPTIGIEGFSENTSDTFGPEFRLYWIEFSKAFQE